MADAAAGGSETILVVEDDMLVRNFVAVQLQALGYKTIAAADGPAALAEARNGATFDLLFTDVVMPGGMTGRQLADEVEKLRPGTKVLYTSGYSDDTSCMKAEWTTACCCCQSPTARPSSRR